MYSKNSKRLIYLFLLLAVPWIARGQEELTLKEAIMMGLKNNYDLNIESRNAEIAKRNYHIGNAGLLPSITLNSFERSRSIVDVNQVFLDGQVNIRENAFTDLTSLSVILDYNLFSGLGRIQTLNKLRELRDVGVYQKQVVKQDIAAEIWANYYKILLEKRLLNVLKVSLQYTGERVRIAKAKFELGRTSKLDYLAAQTDYIADTTELIRQWQILYNSKVDLSFLISRKADQLFEVSDTIIVDEELDYSHLINTAFRRNPGLKALESNRRAAYYARREISAQHFPVVDGFLIYLYDFTESEASFVLENKIQGFNVGLRVLWPIFQGFTLNIQEQNAQSALRIAELQVRQQELRINTEMHKIYLEYLNYIEIAKLEQKNVEIALENTQIVLERYRLGRSDFVQLREVQLNAVRAAARLLEALFVAKRAEIDLLRISGLILPYVYQL